MKIDICHEDVSRFADWSGDRNPLHLDPEAARRTYFGRPIVHWALAVIKALDTVARGGARPIRGLAIEFRGALVPDGTYSVDASEDSGRLSITVGSGDTLLLTIVVNPPGSSAADGAVDLAWVAATAGGTRDGRRRAPAECSSRDLQPGSERVGVYAVGDEAYTPSEHLPAAISQVLGLCSYLVGMELPGLRSLFTRLEVRFEDLDLPADVLAYRARSVRFDPQFRILDTRLEAATPDGKLVAVAEMWSYLRFTPTVTDLRELADAVAPARQGLAGKVAMVCGGSRGLGADLTAALALAGCHVYASCRSSLEEAEALVGRLVARGAQVDILHGDLADAAWCESMLELILKRHGQLDILVLNACAPPQSLRLGAGSESEFEDYLRENLRLVRRPLAAFLPSLEASGGAVLAVSSSFVDQPPAGFASYVALKQAVEGVVRTAARESAGVSYLIARPPKLQTSWNDTPTGVLGTIPAWQAACRMVRVLASDCGPGRVEVLDDFARGAEGEATDGPAAAPAPDWRVVLSASFTADPLLPGLRFWLDSVGLNAGVEIAPYGQVLQELVNPSSLLSSNCRGVNVVLLRVRDWLRELAPQRRGAAEERAYLETTAHEFVRAMRTHRSHASVATVLVVCPSGGAAEEPWLADVGARLVAELADLPGLDLVLASEWDDHYAVRAGEIHDPLREKIAHVPYREAYLATLATIVVRHIHRRLSTPRKVVVVDCDNTLWRGVVGEVGVEGIEFDAAHRELHRSLARLSSEGMLICLCSKNEESDVWPVFQTREDFGLKRHHIVAAMINWRPKSENLRLLASRLNLGLDSFIFVDDNPVECAEVRAGCPEVLTLQWPTQSEQAVQLLRHTWELDAAKGTQEDHRRTQMYREEFRRRELKDVALSFREFLDSLGLAVDVRPLVDEDLPRAAQLTLRTNQFNFTTRRRNEAELRTLLSSGRHECRTVRVCDRFGDYGLVGLLIAELLDGRLVVDTFLLSCRVLGRGVEHHMTAELGRIAVARGASAVRMRVERTKKNAPARAFLQTLVPAERRSHGDDVLECDLPPAELGELRFEPSEETARTSPGALPPDSTPRGAAEGHRVRLREGQIARAAFELSAAANVEAAVARREGPPDAGLGSVAAEVPPSEIGDVVYQAFSRALRVPVDALKRIDQLDLLGCDSFKIVEITVGLIERFPWLPSTLLFEHRSVSEIVRAVLQLWETTAGASAPACAAAAVAARGSLAPVPEGTEIAVVGMNLRCAGANSPEELWSLLSAGRTAIEPVNADRPCFLRRFCDDRPHWAGLVRGVEGFDAEFFGISPREAEFVDPQLRLLLEVAWGAIEDAGWRDAADNADIGVYVGVMYGDYRSAANLSAGRAGNPYRCWESFSMANRLSQVLGFHGPSLAVDTACSSSGTALHIACKALANGDCAAALVGGVNLILDPERFRQLGRLGILSPSGRCLAFGAEADGTVLGEGMGVVVLRPLPEALRRGERVYGVIKGTALSTGTGTVGFTAPNPQAQAEAIRRCLRAARIDPRTVSYVETHGTGTALGDPIEVRGLELAYADRQLWDAKVSGSHHCALGSIKPNIGHLEAGAGVLGLIKVLLQLNRRFLLPSLTSKDLNPHIPFGSLPFVVQRTLEPWERPVMEIDGVATRVPRRAGLNSFGVGGANAHLVVEEAPETPPRRGAVPDRPWHVLTLTARHDTALQERISQVLQHLESHPDLPLADVCHTANAGRKHFEKRVALVAADRDQLVRMLREGAAGSGCWRGAVVSSAASPKIAFLFTGQGAQYVGMGRGLYEAHPVFREALDRCAELLGPLLGRPLLEVIFADPAGPDAGLLHQTGYTQPAMFAIQYALSELWRSWGIRPNLVLGHSVGEVAAMCVAGGLALDDGLKLIAARGRLMQALPEGGVMCSVRAKEGVVQAALRGFEDRVSIAAINSPEQVVISGEAGAVQRITAGLEATGVKTKALTVSHAFHSPLMEPMMADYAAAAEQVRFTVPEIPVVRCVDGVLVAGEVTDAAYWVRQVRQAVRFADAMATLAGQNVDAYVEVGPQPVLTGLGRACVPDGQQRWLPSLRKDADAWRTVLESVAQLYLHGAPIDWAGFDAPYPRRRVPLPSYPFRRRKYWIEMPQHADRAATGVQAPRPDEEALAGRLYEVVWKRVAPADDRQSPGNPGRWILLADQQGIAAALATHLADAGGQCVTVFPGDASADGTDGDFRVDPTQPADFADFWRTVTADGNPIRGVVHLWSLDTPAGDRLSQEGLARARRLGAESVLHLVHTLAKDDRQASPALWLVTRGATDVGEPPPRPLALAQAPLWGLGRVVALEHPAMWGGLIDLAAEGESKPVAATLAKTILAPGGEDQWAIRGEDRFAPRLVPRRERPKRQLLLSSQGTYLVTGGLGALGLHVAGWLVAKGARRILLAGRRGTAPPDVQQALRKLTEAGAQVEVATADVSRAEDVDRLLDAIPAAAPLRGVIHAAGVDAVKSLDDLTAADVQTMFAAKVDGGWLLHQRTRERQLDLFVCFSSIASVWGSAGRAHYAAANAFLDALAHERRRRGLPALSVNWGPWKGGGMAGEEAIRQLERMGNRALSPQAALQALETCLESDDVQTTVAQMDWPRFRAVYEARGRRALLSDISGTAVFATAAVPGDRPGSEEDRTTLPWIERLCRTPIPQRPAELAELLRQEVARTLCFADAGEVQLDAGFAQLGMDSLAAVEFASRLDQRLGICVPASIFDHPDIRALSAYLLGQLTLPPPGAAGSHVTTDPGNGKPDLPGHDGAPMGLLSQLQRLPTPHRAERVEELLRQLVAETLRWSDPREVRPDQPWAQMGMDSLAAVDFASRLQKTLGLCEAPRILDQPHIRALAEQLVGEMRPAVPQGITGFAEEFETQAVALEAAAYPEHRPDWIAPRRQWMFVESARRLKVAPQGWLWRDGERVVGQMGAIPVVLRVRHLEQTTAWLVDTMVLEAYRSQAIGARILMQSRQDIPFALSLGQTEQMRRMMLSLGWRQVAPLQTYVLPLRAYQLLRAKLPHPLLARAAGAGLSSALAVKRALAGSRAPLDVSLLERFDARHDALWESVRDHYRCAVVRDSGYLNWKYTQQPGQEFVRLEIAREGQVVALAVCSFREPGADYRYRRAYLVDLVVSPADRGAVLGTLDAVRQACVQRRADALVFHVINRELEAAVTAYGFLRRPPTRFLLVCPEHPSSEVRAAVLAAENWLITMGDSDIDRPW